MKRNRRDVPSRIVRRVIGGGAAAAVVAMPVVLPGAAHADKPGTVYFTSGGFSCSITDDGVVGCDISTPVMFQYKVGESYVTVPFRVSEVIIDSASSPAHPGLGNGKHHTLPGGNPNIDSFGTTAGSGATLGPAVYHGGATCAIGFHGSFSCTSKGHGFSYYEILVAS